MINTLKNTIVFISFILCFTSCDKVFQPEEDSQPEGDSQPVEDKKNYRYYVDYHEIRSYSSHGELESTCITDYEYDGHKMLSSSRTDKNETTGVVSTTYEKYEYSGLTCKCLISFVGEEANESSYEKTIEYLDDTYRHIRRSTTSRDGHIIDDTENTYDGKCIIQSKSQSYDYRNGEIVPSLTSITTYVTNGLHQVGERRYFDDNGNLTNIYSHEYIYILMMSIGIPQKLFGGIVVVRVVLYIIMMILVESSNIGIITIKNCKHNKYMYTMETTAL